MNGGYFVMGAGTVSYTHLDVYKRQIFSYTFATMAFGQLSLATGNQEYADIAKKTFDIILSKVDNPKGRWNKLHPGTRNLKNFALPMILCNLALEIEHLLDETYLRETMDTCIHEVMEVFYRPELGGIIVENVDIDGNLVDCFEGRQVTPGHAIEAMWFIMDLGKRLNRPELIEKAKETTLTTVSYTHLDDIVFLLRSFDTTFLTTP